MRILGIDPGALGALALLGPDGVFVVDIPSLSVRRGKSDKREVDANNLASLMSDLKPDVAYLEAVGGIQGQSASAAFNFGRACGVPEGILAALGVRTVRVPPGTWKRAIGLKGGKDDSRAHAVRAWPAMASYFARAKDNDRAEAALIALYGQQQERGNGFFG